MFDVFAARDVFFAMALNCTPILLLCSLQPCRTYSLIMSTLPESDLSRAARYAVPFALLLIPLWKTRVSAVVAEPYLDEAFHVPQAQAYWAHQWTHWDPKITTPPGLYLWSYLLCAAMLVLRGSPTQLNADALRVTNVAATAVLLPWRLQTLLETLWREQNSRPAGSRLSHTVLNICLFPPLFFFSGLYYTDILALLVVVEAYNWELKRASTKSIASRSSVIFLGFGLLALVFRQTNIFWVSVFFGGLQVVRTLRQSSSVCNSSRLVDVAKKGLQNELYDPFVFEASIADYFKTAVSLGTTGLRNISPVLVSVIPHVTILAVFGGFVLWNNGVVLGHKEFHSAGLHLPQMLYIWPYFLFFSWPILAVPVANVVLPKGSLPKILNYGFPKRQKGFPALLTIAAVIPVILAVIHFNTIVHPFTLADNRHYVFYAFRILRSHPAVMYGAAVIYFLCAWVVISAFGFSTIPVPPKPIAPPKPPAPTQPAPTKEQEEASASQKEAAKKPQATRRQVASKKTAPPEQPDPVTPEILARIQAHIANRQKQQIEPTRVSFVIIWLAATALSLVTAPLVEPRYFIIPWVLWRLNLPPQPTPAVYRLRRPSEEELVRAQATTYGPMFVETVWFLIVNAVTGYVFLYKGFEWPQEPGRIQRFMW